MSDHSYNAAHAAIYGLATYRLMLPCIAREIPGEDDNERAKRQARERDRIPPLNHLVARDDMQAAGLRS